jgi:hypothetical protein
LIRFQANIGGRQQIVVSDNHKQWRGTDPGDVNAWFIFAGKLRAAQSHFIAPIWCEILRLSEKSITVRTWHGAWRGWIIGDGRKNHRRLTFVARRAIVLKVLQERGNEIKTGAAERGGSRL